MCHPVYLNASLNEVISIQQMDNIEFTFIVSKNKIFPRHLLAT